MTSKTSRGFWKLFHALPVEIQGLAYKNYLLWQNNPRHPSLRFKPIKSRQWPVRVGDHYRAVGHFVEPSEIQHRRVRRSRPTIIEAPQHHR